MTVIAIRNEIFSDGYYGNSNDNRSYVIKVVNIKALISHYDSRMMLFSVTLTDAIEFFK